MFTRLALVAALLSVVGLGGMTHATANDCTPSDTVCQKLQDARQNQANANQRLQDIQQGIADAQQKATQTLAYINELNAQIAAQQAAIADTKAKIAEIERQIRLTSAEIVRREAHLQIRQELLSQRVRAMDKHGSYDYLELIVTSRGFTDLVNRIVIMQDIIRSDNHLVDTLRHERDGIKTLEQKLEQQRQEERDLLKQQQQQEATLEQTRQIQQKALDYYRQLEAQFDAQRKELEAEKAQIDALVNDLQAQYDAEARTLGGGSGQFGWPERGVITQLFGCTDFLAEPYNPNCPTRHWHTGLDIATDYGTPIGAADSGVVSYANWGWGGGYGNFIVINHGNGYATLYAHLSAIYVSAGQPVRRGQTIGAEGSTGFSTGPHLHFEIRYNGAYQNPLSYLA